MWAQKIALAKKEKELLSFFPLLTASAYCSLEPGPRGMAPLLLSLATLLCCAAGDVNVVPLFTSYRGYPDCARQPLLVRTSRALLAFFEGRPGIFPTDTCSGTFYPSAPNFPIYALRSEDSGATWSSPANLTHGNLDFLVSVYDRRAGVVHLLIQSGDSGVIALESRDEGLRWSAPRAINISQPSGFSSLIPGVGHGLQIEGARCGAANPTCSGREGRLVLPFVATRDGPVSNDTACGTCASALVFSDDGGQSWELGAVSEQNGSREASLAQLDRCAGGGCARELARLSFPPLFFSQRSSPPSPSLPLPQHAWRPWRDYLCQRAQPGRAHGRAPARREHGRRGHL